MRPFSSGDRRPSIDGLRDLSTPNINNIPFSGPHNPRKVRPLTSNVESKERKVLSNRYIIKAHDYSNKPPLSSKGLAMTKLNSIKSIVNAALK
jgi:hypothetical protein